MQYPDTNEERAWTLGRWAAALILVVVTVWLVPPGSLPYPLDAKFSDAAISHWPNAYFLRESVWGHGEWPLWNPLRMLGQPFAANPLSKVWYPPQWLVLLLPPTLHLNLMLYLHMAWLALGIFAWMRSERAHLLTAFFATMAWGLTPKLIGHLGAGHLDIVYALAWVPWLLWASSHSVDTPSMGWGVLSGVIAAMLALADLRIAFYMLPVAAVYGIAASLVRQRAVTAHRQLWIPAPIVFLLLTAVQTVPLLTLSSYLTRASLTPQEAALFSLPPRYLLGLLIPDLSGFQEWMTYLGLPVVGLAACALVQRKNRAPAWLWWGVAVFALLWALGANGPLFLPIVEHLPLAGWFRIPSRAWFVVAFSLVIASASGLDTLLEHGLSRRWRLTTLGFAFAGAVWFVAAWALSGLPPVLMGTGLAVFGTGTGLWLAGGGLTDVAASCDPSARRRGQMMGTAILLVTLALSLLGVDATLVTARSMADIERPEQAIIDHIDGSCGSTFSPTFDLIGPATARAGIATLHGVDPFQLWWSAENIAGAAGVEVDGYSVIAPPLPPGEVDPRSIDLNVELLKTLGVCWVVAEPSIPSTGMQLVSQLDHVTVYHLTGGQLDSHSLTLDVQAAAGVNTFETHVCTDRYWGSAVIPQAWAPGWRAWIDDEPVPVMTRGGLLVIEFNRKPGCYTVKLAYRPLADFIGMAVTGVAALTLAAWSIFRRGKEAHSA